MEFLYQLKRTQDIIRALWILKELKKHERWTREKLANFQHQQLSLLISYAVNHSPFYKELYKNININQPIILNDLPVINKATMMENFDRFVTDPSLKLAELQTHIRQLSGDEYYLGKYRVFTTSGSSGVKGVFVYNRKEWSTNLAGGYRGSSLVAADSLRFPNRLKETKIYAGNAVHITYRMTVSGQLPVINTQRLSAASSIESQVNALNAFQPEFLSTYPSIASLLAIEQLEGRLNIHPKVVVTAAETRTKEMESNIQKAWNVMPFNVYGSTEGGAFNVDCPSHRGIHIFEDLTIMEVVDDKNQPVPDGSLGNKILITNLFNYTQPLIRYEITDMVTISNEVCPCGRSFRLITKVEGRNDDIIYLRNASGLDIPVHHIHFTTAVGVVKGIKEYRIVHDDKGLIINVVLRKGSSEDNVTNEIKVNLIETLQTLGVKYPDIHIRFIDKIDRDPDAMGKVKLIQSNIRKAKTGNTSS
ncbi:MAG TPA: hypothetical protein PKY32_02395 [Smithellaceae bacterium]|mgnify:FL=1|nr:hypothetical protein [Smithellaceae bacterium]